tara:strand:- start:12589 stop:13332 length:744 start_codon:yes stop_codon:yes gene_type:complete
MKKFFISYANNVFKKHLDVLVKSCQNSKWFDRCEGFGPDDLDDDFKTKFARILKEAKGGGYWIWKPYIIKKKLEQINDGEYLIYLDAGCTLNTNAKKRFDEYIDMLYNSNLGIVSFQLEYPEHAYTKKEIFDHFKLDETSEHYNSGQIMSGIIVIKKNEHSVKLINEWYETVDNNASLFTDNTGIKNPGYIANRHDQSILSVISKIHGSILLGEETYFGWENNCGGFGQPESLKYPFWATRIKNATR